VAFAAAAGAAERSIVDEEEDMAEVVVTAEIDVVDKKVTLSSNQGDLQPPKTFSVDTGDTLEWRLRVVKGELGGRRPRVRFVTFPKPAEERPLLENHGNTVEAEADTGTGGHAIRGKVSKEAHPGEYRYDVELAGPAGNQLLTCHWASVPGGAPQPVSPPMGGGEKRGGPGG
jgi:hypothetical protein